MVEKSATLSFHKLNFDKNKNLSKELSKAKEKIDSICEELFAFTNESYSLYKSKQINEVKNFKMRNKNLSIIKMHKTSQYNLNLHPSFAKIYKSFEQSIPLISMKSQIETKSRNKNNNFLCNKENTLNNISYKFNSKNTLKNEENMIRSSCFKLSGMNRSQFKVDTPTISSNVITESFCHSNTQQSETFSKDDFIASKFKSKLTKIKTDDKIKINHISKDNNYLHHIQKNKTKPNKNINLINNNMKNVSSLIPILKTKHISYDFSRNHKEIKNKDLNIIIKKLNTGTIRFCKLRIDKDN